MEKYRLMEKELCVRCGKETAYDINYPVDLRKWYVEELGQLCEKCWKKLWLTKEEIKDGKRKSTIEARLG